MELKTASGDSPKFELESIAETIRGCADCPLHKTRKNAVPGQGSHKARVVFVGEGPGRFEDEAGAPFVGRAGELLNQLLAEVNILRDDVFITNIIKCRPPQNRDPAPDEVQSCEKYLKRQLDLIRPDVIVTLGRHALNWFRPDSKISQMHGAFFVHKDSTIILPLYHPAAALRNSALLTELKSGFAKISAALVESLKMRANAERTQTLGGDGAPVDAPRDANAPESADEPNQSNLL